MMCNVMESECWNLCRLPDPFARTSSTSMGSLFPFLCLIVLVIALHDDLNQRAQILVRDGQLIFQGAPDRNIHFSATGSGKVLLNDQVLSSDTASSLSSVVQRLEALEKSASSSSFTDTPEERPVTGNTALSSSDLREQLSQLQQLLGTGSERLTGRAIRRAVRKVSQLSGQVARLTELLRTDECRDSPCRNGGTCSDLFAGFQCACPSSFTGTTCEADVNECSVFAGTDVGCQNGATCRNTHGGYQCLCAAGYFGVHCTERSDDCLATAGHALCEHGTCVNQANPVRGNGSRHYRCICDQGWTGADCSQDVDECRSPRYPCSVSPKAECVNVAGGFACASCPAGFTGSGHSCFDVDECLVGNGGCSLSPRVQCTNSPGSRSCGPCPPGFAGDGQSCQWVGVCDQSACHPLATCLSNSAISASFRQCRCPPGFAGSGVGAEGCVRRSSRSCYDQPCLFGSCHPDRHENGFSCHCFPGYSGRLCSERVDGDACASAPCRNGGTCLTSSAGTYSCACTSDYQGDHCEEERSACGGVLHARSGSLVHPSAAHQSYYLPNSDCAWVVRTDAGQVVTLTFTNMSLEEGPDCAYDSLSVYDGPDHSFPVMRKVCGSALPAPVTSSHNSVYLWFHSDPDRQSDGFRLLWNSSAPTCGGALPPADFGSVHSPAYPGHYPPDRDCFWLVRVAPNSRIAFSFALVAIESHADCAFDFFKIYDGPLESDPLLKSICNTSLPAPVTTSGETALLHFHSDHSLTDRGFHVTYTSVPGMPGCGGLLTAASGALSSPNFPDAYADSVRCDWLIRVHPDERVQLRFRSLDLESGPRRDVPGQCSFDYVEVRDGSDESAPLVGRFCGSTLPANQQLSSRNTMWIRFHADASFAGSGFRLEYWTACGGVFESETGLLSSPNFPDAYPSARQCQYRVVVPLGHVVLLTFLDFDVECGVSGGNYLQVSSRNGSLIRRLCGSDLPHPLLSDLNQLVLDFRTDGSGSNRGFRANFSSIDVGCGGVMTQSSGSFSSPPTGSCSWLLSAPPGFIVRLSFPLFALDCALDYVQLYDWDHQPLGSRMCGTSAPPAVQSSGSEMLVTLLVSDASRSVPTDSHLTAQYLFVNASAACGGHLLAPSGVVRSPGFPDPYPPFRDCVWVLHAATERQQLVLNFTFFDVENQTTCDYDFVEIRNGGDGTSPLIGRFCGSTAPPLLVSHSHQVWLRFRSDSSLQASGFEVWFGTAAGSGCGGRLTAPSGMIQSPAYPAAYGHDAECVWSLRTAPGSLITLTVLDMELETSADCQYDYVQLWDSDSDSQLAKICAPSAVHSRFSSAGNTLTVRFRSDSSQSGRGFRLSYSTNCSTRLTGRRGVIESPGFPDAYPHLLNCSWTIAAPRGNNLTVAFSDLSLEGSSDCVFDWLSISQTDPLTGEEQQVDKWCGSYNVSLPAAVTVSSSRATVRFVTDAVLSQTGFRLEWTAVGCGGDVVDKEYGTITSPNFPNGYPHNAECVWRIQTEPGKTVVVRFLELDMESGSPDCAFDRVQVLVGRDPAVEIFRTCHRMSAAASLSTGSDRVTIRFTSDSSVTGRGFRIRFLVTANECGGRFSHLESHRLTSPRFPLSYSVPPTGALVCDWSLTAPSGHLLQVTIQSLDLPDNCSRNFLAVYEAVGERQRPIARLCRMPQPPDDVLLTTSSHAVVSLQAQEPGKGFSLLVRQVCGGQRTADRRQQVLTSPNFPHGSLTMDQCNWTLTAEEPADRILLSFAQVFAPGDDCQHSHVRVRDGEDADAPVVLTLCSSRTPGPVVSHGRSLTVHMVGSVIFRAVFTSALSSCGVTEMTAGDGVIVSPGFPDAYPVDTVCRWTLLAPAGNRVALSFTRMHMEESDFCNQDYVQVRDESRVVGRWCGSDLPVMPHNVSSSRSLEVTMRTDGTGSAPGFQAKYVLVHGVALSGSDGEIQSPGFPMGLITSSPQPFRWTIATPTDSCVRLSATVMQLPVSHPVQCLLSHCFVQLWDGDETGADMGQWCGLSPPSPVTASGNRVTVLFYCRGTVIGKFELQWLAVPCSASGPYPAANETETFTSETRLFVHPNSSFDIDSPGYPHGYAADLRHALVLQTEPGFHLRFNVTDMDVEGRPPCLYDRLLLSDPDPDRSDAWVVRRTLCGSVHSLTDRSVDMASHRTQLLFLTDAYYNLTGYRLRASVACGGIFSDTSGVVTSDYAPLHGNCTWRIRVRSGRTIRLSLELLDVRNGGSVCTDSYLMVRNGESEQSPPLGPGRVCGTTPLPDSSSHNLWLQWVSNPVLLADVPRLRLRYEEMSAECGGRVFLTESRTSVVIQSPGYPHVPPHSLTCDWTVSAPPDRSLRLDPDHSVTPFPVPCNSSYEYVLVSDGGTIASPSLRQMCVPVPPMASDSVRSTGHLMFVRFLTSGSPVAAFRATVSMHVCGGTYFVTSSRSVTGPFPQQDYANNMDCRYLFRTDPQHSLTFSSSAGSSQLVSESADCSRGDFVELRNDDADGSVIGRFCGNTSIAGQSDGDRVFLLFQSDFVNTGRGFHFRVSVNFSPCGGEMENLEDGTVTSPNFPHSFPYHRSCEWRVTVPRDKQLRIQFPVFIMKKSIRNSECLDRLTIVSRNAYRDVVHEVDCSSTRPEAMTVMGMTEIRMRTRGLAANEGFRLTYRLEEAECGGLLTQQAGDLTSLGFGDSEFLNRSIECSWLFAPDLDVSSTRTIGAYFDVFEVPVEPENSFQYGCTSGVFAIGNDQMRGEYCGNKTGKNFYTLIFPPLPSSFFYLSMNYTDGHRGVRGRYSIQECGGDFVDPVDVNITSPGYPVSYPPNTLCAWFFRCDVSSAMEVVIEDLQLESDCDKDFVEMRQGIGLPVLRPGKWCGSIQLPVTISHSGHLLVVMRTDGDGVGKGFRMRVDSQNTMCGGTLRSAHMRIASPNFPHADYGNDMECVWIIDVDPDFRVNVTFHDSFDLERADPCTKDYLLFQEWLHDQWVNLTVLCGHDLPTPFASRSHKMRIIFRTNEVTTAAGFSLSYHSLCGSVMDGDEGVIASPNYPDTYPDGVVCEYRIQRPNSMILLSFRDFVLEPNDCKYDYVTVFSGNATSFGPYCGRDADDNDQRPPKRILVRDELLLKFVTDGSLTYRGFEAAYRVMQCGGLLTDDTGLVSSPLLPDDMRINCTWVIRVKEQLAVGLKFKSLNLSDTCLNCRRCDHISIRDGPNATSPLVTRICTNKQAKRRMRYKIRSNVMTLQFVKRNDLRFNSSFRAVYRETLGQKQGCGGFRFANSSGTIQFPSSEEDFIAGITADGDVECDWTLFAPRDMRFRLSFESFGVGEDSVRNKSFAGTCTGPQYLELRDGSSDSHPLMDRICGSTVPDSVATSRGQLFLRLRSDSVLSRSVSFRVRYSLERVSCGGMLLANNVTQVLTSPNFPLPYEAATRCRWHFRTPVRGERIAFNFTVFDISCANGDMIEFSFSSGSYSPTRMCESSADSLPRLLAPNDLWMTWQAGASVVQRTGFRMEYRLADCNQTYTNGNGMIVSSAGPDRPARDKYCWIRITAPAGRSIALYFVRLELTNGDVVTDPPCAESRMQVRSGVSMSDPVLDTRCGRRALDPVFSTSNLMSIYVRTVRGSHLFNLLYTTTDQGAGCGGNLTAFDGSFTSPWFPAPYTSTVPCRWFLRSLGHHSLSLSFPVLSLSSSRPCTSNFLEVYQLTESPNHLLSRFCGDDTPASIRSEGDLLVKLVVDADNAGSGFRALFHMNALWLDAAAPPA